MKCKLDAHIKIHISRSNSKSSYVSTGGEIGSIIFTNPLGNKLDLI
jgi:hypothetical protein